MAIYRRYRQNTMVPAMAYCDNLMLAMEAEVGVDDWIVECGTWRGGMAAGLIDATLGKCNYAFFDSFAGLPPADARDGVRASAWQANVSSDSNYNNCTASLSEFSAVIQSTQRKALRVDVHEGQFKDTIKAFDGGDIAVLRLDGDWYESTYVCLEGLFHRVKSGGIVIIDDYGVWDGCTRAVHDYLSTSGRAEPIKRSPRAQVAYVRRSD